MFWFGKIVNVLIFDVNVLNLFNILLLSRPSVFHKDVIFHFALTEQHFYVLQPRDSKRRPPGWFLGNNCFIDLS